MERNAEVGGRLIFFYSIRQMTPLFRRFLQPNAAAVISVVVGSYGIMVRCYNCMCREACLKRAVLLSKSI